MSSSNIYVPSVSNWCAALLHLFSDVQPISQVCERTKHIVPSRLKQPVSVCFSEALHCLPPCFRSFAHFTRSVDSPTARITPIWGRSDAAPAFGVADRPQKLTLTAALCRNETRALAHVGVSQPSCLLLSQLTFLMMCKAVNQVKYGGVCCD